MNTSSASSANRQSLPPLSTDVRAAEVNLSGAPRVWFLTDGLSPIAIALSRTLLRRGDYVVSSILPEEFKGPRGDGLRNFIDGMKNEPESGGTEIDDMDDMSTPPRVNEKGWKERFKLVFMDPRYQLSHHH
jgi:hypothetical protein